MSVSTFAAINLGEKFCPVYACKVKVGGVGKARDLAEAWKFRMHSPRIPYIFNVVCSHNSVPILGCSRTISLERPSGLQSPRTYYC